MALDIELPIQSLEAEEVKLDTVDEDQAIHDLESQIQMMEETRNVIETSKSVNRAQVQELVNECGYVPDEDCPVNSYTEEPSKTNLSVTVESIWSATKSILAAIVEKVKEILKKIFDFIDGLIGKWLSKSKNYTKVKETLKYLLMTREEVAQNLKKHGLDLDNAIKDATSHTEPNGESKYGPEFDKLIASGSSTMERWASDYNDLVHYLFSETALTDGLQAATIATQHAFNILHKKLATMVELSKELSQIKKSNNIRSATDKLNSIAKPVDAGPFKAAAHLFDVTNGKPPVNSMMDCAQYMSTIIQKLASEHALPPLTPEVFVRDYFAGEKRQHHDVVFPAEYIRKQMDEDKPLLASLVTRVGAGDRDSELVQAYQNAAKSLVQEFNAAQNILFIVAQVNRNIYYFMTLAINLYENQLNMAMIMARHEGNEGLVKETEAAFDKLKRQLKSF